MAAGAGVRRGPGKGDRHTRQRASEMADAEMQVGNDRVSASEVRVDLREALSDVDARASRAAERTSEGSATWRQERPPIWDEQGPRQRHPLPPLDQQPRAQQPFNSQPQAAQAVAEPQPVTEPEDPLSTELLPADIYRIVDGKEVRDTPWTRFVGRAAQPADQPAGQARSRSSTTSSSSCASEASPTGSRWRSARSRAASARRR